MLDTKTLIAVIVIAIAFIIVVVYPSQNNLEVQYGDNFKVMLDNQKTELIEIKLLRQDLKSTKQEFEARTDNLEDKVDLQHKTVSSLIELLNNHFLKL
jgi:hypothetical protein